MKRISAIILVIVLALSMAGCSRLSLSEEAKGQVVYAYEEISFADELTASEVQAVITILDGKKQYSGFVTGVPSCGFDDDIAIIIDGERFALACDDCGTLQNCNNRLFIDISDEERAILESIFTSRGGTFPCI